MRKLYSNILILGFALLGLTLSPLSAHARGGIIDKDSFKEWSEDLCGKTPQNSCATQKEINTCRDVFESEIWDVLNTSCFYYKSTQTWSCKPEGWTKLHAYFDDFKKSDPYLKINECGKIISGDNVNEW